MLWDGNQSCLLRCDRRSMGEIHRIESGTTIMKSKESKKKPQEAESIHADLRIETRSVASLSGDPANARKHNETNINAIIGSLRRFGQQKPIVIDMNNVVRAGNGTLEAARQLGWESIQCVITTLQGSEAIAYAIADNRTAELAEWDDEILAAQLNGLLSESEDIALAAGFTADEIEEMNQIPDFDPGTEDDQGQLDQIEPKMIECPHCKKEFDCREQI